MAEMLLGFDRLFKGTSPFRIRPLELITSPFCVLGIIFLDFFQGEKGVTFKF